MQQSRFELKTNRSWNRKVRILDVRRNFMKYFLILPCLFAFSCQSSTNTISEKQKQSIQLTIKSKELLKKGVLDSAEILIEKAIELDPRNFTAFNNRAYLKRELNYPPKEVIADLKRSLEIKPGYDMALFSLANYAFDLKHYNKTIELANQVISLSDYIDVGPDEIQQLYAIRGESYKNLENYDKAISDLQTALRMKPDIASSYKELGDCYYYGTKDITLAIEHYTKAISLDSNYYQAFLGRAQCYENTAPALTNAANANYQSALQINPNLQDIYNTNSTLLLNARKHLSIKPTREN